VVQHASRSAAEDWSDPKQPELADSQPPTKRAGPVERAGLTEVFVTGMLTRWIKRQQSPIAIGAKPPLPPCVTELVLTMMSLFVIMGATHGKAPAGFAPIAIDSA